ncbi:MAG: radical SAM protein [Syntrophobacter sp.]
MPDVLLIQPPIRDFYLTAKRTIPYGLASIASALERDGFSVRIIDALATPKAQTIRLPREMGYLKEFYPTADISPFSLFHQFKHFGYGFEQIGELARESGAVLIGISSLFTAYSDEAIETAEAVKRKCPGAAVVLGGHHPTELPGEVLRHECVDYVIRGEGEAALPRLARALTGRLPLEDVPGIGFRMPDGGIFVNPPAVIQDLDAVASPAVELIDSVFYRRKGKPSAVIVSSRGCPLRCSYCSVGGAAWSRFRLKSTDTVMRELELAVFDFGARFIDFEDENISFERKWFLSLLGRIKERFAGYGLELRAMNGLFPPTLDEEVVRAMKEAGFTALNLSLCTTCAAQLKRFRRPDVRESFENAVRLAGKYRLECVGYIIVGAPEQDAEESLADLLYLLPMKVLAGVSVFYPAPGSSDFEKCRERGLLPDRFSLMRATALPITDTTTRLEAATLLRLGRVVNFMKTLSAGEMREVAGGAGTLARPAFGVSGSELGRNMEGGSRKREHEPGQPKPSEKSVVDCLPGGHIRGGRREIGKVLLGMFVRDGIIRGVKPDGEIFEHLASRELCMKFREMILGMQYHP